MVGTAGFSAVVEITKAFEPATDGYLQTTTEAVAYYSPLLCQIELRPDCYFFVLSKLNKRIAKLSFIEYISSTIPDHFFACK